ncbi:MAG: hypothetical protein Q4C81_04010 [Kocuria sp.]|nr:hypothetical protein [Kocuria sp.]
MNLRSTARNEFPRGWWRSRRWWLESLRELVLNCLTAIAAVIFAREAGRLVRDRDSPQALSIRRISTEGWTAGFLVGCTVFVSMAALAALAAQDSASDQGVVLAIAIVGALWSLAGVATSATALAVLVRSRIRHRADWEEIDFIEANAPKHGQPPETVEEYRALRLKSES